MTGRVLVTGATGFIGARLATALASSRWDVRCLVRDRGGSRARALDREGFDLHEGDVLRPETLRGAGQGVDVAYYLIHSMGRGGPKDFAAREECRVRRGDLADEGDEPRVAVGGALVERVLADHVRRGQEEERGLGIARVADAALVGGRAPPTPGSPGWHGRRGSGASSTSAASATYRNPRTCAAGTRPRLRSGSTAPR